jgi:hypothetical protein
MRISDPDGASTCSYTIDSDGWTIMPSQTINVPHECGTLVHARAICNLARENMNNLIPYVSLPSWAVCKLLDELELREAAPTLVDKCEGVKGEA